MLIRQIRNIDVFIGKIEYVVVALLSALIAIILIAQVVLRYVFSNPLFWAEEITVQLLVLLSFWGASLAIQRRETISIDLMSHWLTERLRGMVLVFINLISLIVIAWLCYYSSVWIMRPEVHADLSPTTQLPKWYNYSLMIVALYFMAWHFLTSLFRERPES